ncbi:ElaB/YqjD/DUF883 family membrane-anchored ribosome-binding protein [Rhizobium sp. 1399]|jgi:ElaB/YqjD/DUF883 family membrane-anchored ribosome-binding protein|nr:ElaB/YqjD/DUF883 family membrane-anchored ribosome-binding protein [Rhizobium sp. 1399]
METQTSHYHWPRRADIRRSIKQSCEEMKASRMKSLRDLHTLSPTRRKRQKMLGCGTFTVFISLKRHSIKQEQTMAELKTASAESTAARVKAEVAAEDLSAQVAALRDDLARLSESVIALGQGAKTAVTDEASVMTERVRDKVREEPLTAIAITAGVAYLFGLLSRR